MRDKQKILRTAEKYVLDQKSSAAIREYEKLLELEPDEPTLLNIVGDLLVRQGKPQEALKNFQRVVEIFLNLGFAPKAIAMLKKTLWIAPQDMLARESLADLYSKQGFQFDAVRELRYLVDHYVDNDNVDRALHFLKRIGSISPENAEIPLRKAELLIGQGKEPAALEAHLEALECLRKNGDFPTFKQILGTVLRADRKTRQRWTCSDKWERVVMPIKKSERFWLPISNREPLITRSNFIWPEPKKRSRKQMRQHDSTRNSARPDIPIARSLRG